MRTVIGPDGRRYSVTDPPLRSLSYAYVPRSRRNTITALDNTAATADPPSTDQHCQSRIDYSDGPLRRNTVAYYPSERRASGMSKVVRSVKNVTKGYSSVQVKVRNGKIDNTQ